MKTPARISTTNLLVSAWSLMALLAVAEGAEPDRQRFAPTEREAITALEKLGAKVTLVGKGKQPVDANRPAPDEVPGVEVTVTKDWSGTDDDLKYARSLSTLRGFYVLGEGKVTDKTLAKLRASCPQADVWRVPEVRLGILIARSPADGPSGVEISSVISDSPAARAGMRPGDNMIRFAGEPTPEFIDFHRLLIRVKPGQKVDVELLRDEQTLPVTVAFPESEKPLVAMGISPLLGGDSGPPKRPGQDVNQTVFSDVSSTKRAQLRSATPAELRNMMSEDDSTLALYAAWEAIRRTLPKTKQPRGSKPDPLALARFAGYVQGRLRVPVPEFWDAALCSVQSNGPGLDWIHIDENCRYRRTASGFCGPAHLELERVSDGLRVVSGMTVIRIGNEMLDKADQRSQDAVNLLATDDRCYVALHGGECSPYQIACLDRKNNGVVWSSTVQATGRSIEWSGPPLQHVVSLIVQGETLLVFGAGNQAVYIEGFAASDGKNQFRFCTFDEAAPK